jgi:hypothetical protein
LVGGEVVADGGPRKASEHVAVVGLRMGYPLLHQRGDVQDVPLIRHTVHDDTVHSDHAAIRRSIAPSNVPVFACAGAVPVGFHLLPWPEHLIYGEGHRVRVASVGDPEPQLRRDYFCMGGDEAEIPSPKSAPLAIRTNYEELIAAIVEIRIPVVQIRVTSPIITTYTLTEGNNILLRDEREVELGVRPNQTGLILASL